MSVNAQKDLWYQPNKPQWRVRQTGRHTALYCQLWRKLTQFYVTYRILLKNLLNEGKFPDAHKYHNIRKTPNNTCQAYINKHNYAFIFFLHLLAYRMRSYVPTIYINAVWKYLNLMKVCCDHSTSHKIKCSRFLWCAWNFK